MMELIVFQSSSSSVLSSWIVGRVDVKDVKDVIWWEVGMCVVSQDALRKLNKESCLGEGRADAQA